MEIDLSQKLAFRCVCWTLDQLRCLVELIVDIAGHLVGAADGRLDGLYKELVFRNVE